MERHLKNMGRAIQGKPAETDAKENGKIARVFKGAFKVEAAKTEPAKKQPASSHDKESR